MSKSNPSPRSRIRVTTRLLGVFLLALLTSACTMRGLVGLDVEADGSGTFSVTIALDEELRTLLEEDSEEPIDWTDPSSFEGEDSPADLVDEFPEGASISPYTDEDFEGFTVDVAFSSLEELEEILAETSTEGEAAFPLRVTEDNGRFEITATDDLFDEAAPSGDEMDMFSDAMLQD
ncbi:MAG: hypothetical protein ACLFWM_09470, partial [Actinomycetota bacterium]